MKLDTVEAENKELLKESENYESMSDSDEDQENPIVKDKLEY